MLMKETRDKSVEFPLPVCVNNRQGSGTVDRGEITHEESSDTWWGGDESLWW